MSSGTPIPAPGWDALPLGVAVCDSQRRVLWANEQLLALTEWTGPDLQGRNLSLLLGPDAGAQLLQSAEPPSHGLQARLRRKDGSSIQVLVHRRPLHGRDGDWLLTLGAGAMGDVALAAQAALGQSLGELRETHDRLSRDRAALALLDSALDAANTGAWSRDLSTGKLSLRGPVARVFAIEPEQLPRDFPSLMGMVHPEDALKMGAELQRARRERDGFQLLFRLDGSDGKTRWIEARGAFSRDEAGEPERSTGVFNDVTELKRSRDELQTAHRRVRSLLESITDGFVALDRDWRYSYVNRRGAEMLGRTDPSSLIGKHIWTEFPEGEHQAFADAYRRALDEQIPLTFEGFYKPWDRWFENRIFPSPGGLTIFFTDITDRKLVEQQLREGRDRLRALAARLQRVREQENARLARLLDAAFGDTLTALHGGLQWLTKRMISAPSEPELRARFDAITNARLLEMGDLVDDAVAAVRTVVTDLRPAALDERGLPAALDWLVAELNQRGAVHAELHDLAPGAAPSQDVSTALFRILQQALSNAEQSGAQRVQATLSAADGTLRLEVKDDGRRLDPAESADPRSLGLADMQERALAVGGEVTDEATEAGGTRVIASVPAGQLAARSAH